MKFEFLYISLQSQYVIFNLIQMELLNYNEIENLYVSGPILGDIEQFLKRIVSSLSEKEEIQMLHPKEKERQERLNSQSNEGRYGNILGDSLGRIRRKNFRDKQKSYNDSIVIVASNCGIGIKSNNYYKEIFEKFNPILEKNNCHILFVRGNYDNPSFYDGSFGTTNIVCLKDYTVVKCKNFSVLCIGGGISIDRSWKKTQEERINKKLYFENENVTYNSDEIKNIIEHYTISAVVTCTSPSFTYPSTSAITSTKWANNDKSLSDELKKERAIMDTIYGDLVLANKPYVWFYGKFNQSQQAQANDILFVSLNKNNILSFNTLVEEYFGIVLGKKHAKKSDGYTVSSSFFYNFDFGQQENIRIERDGLNEAIDRMDRDVPNEDIDVEAVDEAYDYIDDENNLFADDNM